MAASAICYSRCGCSGVLVREGVAASLIAVPTRYTHSPFEMVHADDLDATLDLTLEVNRDLLKRGAVLVDDKDFGVTPRVLCILEHGVQDASLLPNGERRTVSRM